MLTQTGRHYQVLIGILSVIACFIAGIANAQEIDLKQTISVRFDNSPLEKVLEDISRKSGLKFSYSPDQIPADRKINYQCDKCILESVLNDILTGENIGYRFVGGYLILHRVQKNKSGGNQPKPDLITISGIISDSANNETLIGAAVYCPELRTGCVSNNYGFYSLTLPRGSYIFQISYIGHSVHIKKQNLQKDFSWNIRLKPIPFTIKEIEISPLNQEYRINQSLAGQTGVDPGSIRRMSAPLGETDMLKSLENIPGISFQSDGSSYFSVRGGLRDQNLILLDEAPVFNPSHMLGIFTPIIPEAIKNAEIYKADFPVQYGGRLSSIIDIRTRDGNMNRFSGTASISPISVRFSTEGPMRKNYSSFFVSARVSTFGLLAKAANSSIEKFYFADFTAKLNFKAGKRDRFFLTLFNGRDAFINKTGQIRRGLEWGNTTLTFRWSHTYGSKLFSNTTLHGSGYNYSLYSDYDKKTSWNSDIRSLSLKTELTWYLRPRNTWRLGASFGGYHFNPGNYNTSIASLDTSRVSEINSGEYVFFAGNEIGLTDWLKIRYGIRYTNWSNYGEAFVMEYDKYYNPVTRNEYARGIRYYSSDQFEPRLAALIKTGPLLSLKLSYNHTIQNINQVNNTVSPFNSLEVWLPSGPNLRPQSADIFDLGLMKGFRNSSLEISADVFYKRMQNITGYVNHAELLLNSYLEGELRQGKGMSYGFEVMLRKNNGRFTGQLSYTFLYSRLKIPDNNNNRRYPSVFDKPVDISLTLDFKVNPGWSLNLNTVYASGMRITAPSGFYNYRGSQVPVYGEQNNEQLPDYNRIDINSTWQLNKTGRRFEHFFSFSIFNLLNTHNYILLNFNKIQYADDKFYVPSDKLNEQTVNSTYRYVYSLIPSFTYSLRF